MSNPNEMMELIKAPNGAKRSRETVDIINKMAVRASDAGAIPLKSLYGVGLLCGDHEHRKEFETWKTSNRICWPNAQFAQRWANKAFTGPSRDTDRFQLVDRQFDLEDGRTVIEHGYIDNEANEKAVLYFFV